MEQLTARWMQIQRFGADQIQRIHEAEKSGYQEFLKAVEERRSAAKIPHFIVYSMHLFDEFNGGLGPYWAKGKLESEKSQELKEFERRVAFVYPKYINNPALDELDALHKADIEVWKSVKRPNTEIARRSTDAADKGVY